MFTLPSSPVGLLVCSLGIGLLLVSPDPARARSTAVGVGGAVAAEHEAASLAGIEVLKAGGNAVDAAVASTLAIGVVNPSSAGIGGGGFCTVFLRKGNRIAALDFRERASETAHRNLFTNPGVPQGASRRGGRAVGIPGEPAGLWHALELWGELRMPEVAAPAIRLAREGTPIGKHLARSIASNRDGVSSDPGLASVFLKADGTPRSEGELLQRPLLAATLERYASDGPSAIYSGATGGALVTAVRKAGGSITLRDLAAYLPILREPLTSEYRGRKMIMMPPPSSGGGTMAEALAVLEAYDLKELGHTSPTYLHLLAETLKAVFSDRARLYGDPDFVDVPMQRLLSPAHASSIRRKISPARARPSAEFGNVATADDAGTSHVSVIDGRGNAASCTSSVNTAFGAMLSVPGHDIILNNTMDDFSIRPGVPNAFGLLGSEANAVAAKKRPLSSMSPTIVLHGGRARYVAGASGGPLIITSTLQTILNLVDFEMDALMAVGSPRIHHQWMPEVLGVERTVPRSTREALERRGHMVRELPFSASVQVVEAVPGSVTVLRAVSDRRKHGTPAAY